MSTRYRMILVSGLTLLVTYFFLVGFTWAMASNGAGTTPDPFQDVEALYFLLRDTWRTGGAWPAIVLGAYALLAGARVRIGWLKRGKAAAWSAAALGVIGALVDLTAGAGSWSGVLIAVASGVLLLKEPEPKPTAATTPAPAPRPLPIPAPSERLDQP